MKRIYGAALAAALVAAAAQPAAGQDIQTDCLVTGGGQILANSTNRGTFGSAVDSDRVPLGTEIYIEHGDATEISFRSLAVHSVVCNLDARRAVIIGTGQMDSELGTLIVQYRIEVFAPNNRTGARDTYRITLSSGYDSGEQPVTGNINIIAR